ncbi:MAG: NfeD family protein [Mycobacteriaceae bacterium]|nr:NfeD family protein [Mycobacteriaceae bacterium]
MVALVWLIAGILLAAAEMLTGEFSLLMLGGGALITAAVSYVTNFAAWVTALIFGAVSGVLLFVLRPMLLRRFAGNPPHPTNIDALPGRTALVVESVGAHEGQVKLDGDIWTARPLVETDEYPEGASVTVMRIDGAIAVVWKGP